MLCEAVGLVPHGLCKPQAGVRLRLRRQVPQPAKTQAKLRPKLGPSSWISGSILRTDIDGYLHFREPLAPGMWTIQVEERRVLHGTPKLRVPSRELFEVRVASGNAEGQAFWRALGFDDLMDVLHKRL